MNLFTYVWDTYGMNELLDLADHKDAYSPKKLVYCSSIAKCNWNILKSIFAKLKCSKFGFKWDSVFEQKLNLMHLNSDDISFGHILISFIR